jgi:hypothetical protein
MFKEPEGCTKIVEVRYLRRILYNVRLGGRTLLGKLGDR